MANPSSNKKKIRGWRRRIKQIDQWKQRFIDLDMEEMFRSNRDYVKLWIDPFFRLTRRNPPIWYSRLLLEAMIEVYQSWYQQMKRLDEPFYLKIWLYHPNFINSQIVVAFRDCLHFYDNTFEKSNDKRDFPSQLYGKIASLQDFKWELALESEYYRLTELQEDVTMGLRTDKSIEAIKNKAYKDETVKLSTGEDTVYSVKLGDVWLGELI
ncbi:hypothetical protein J2Z32_001821 [Paenibacillus turicensis]|uniref:Group-specific protein n=1 Tax=Paenibacillus turicensis TaxID=160487 RepID=A0ABS4FRI4_9BACL|nr:hypothetical protein [Paenibacillus turicensis]MBP1905193.1 hypothetical protein [Paenibacillus turicensis]